MARKFSIMQKTFKEFPPVMRDYNQELFIDGEKFKVLFYIRGTDLKDVDYQSDHQWMIDRAKKHYSNIKIILHKTPYQMKNSMYVDYYTGFLNHLYICRKI